MLNETVFDETMPDEIGLNKATTFSVVWSSAQTAVLRLFQIIDIRLALLMGLAAFMLAVGFDSSGHPAAAADLVTRSSPVPVKLASAPSSPGRETGEPWTSEVPLATSHHLRYGGLTRAIITNSHLTDAHFLTDLPAQR